MCYIICVSILIRIYGARLAPRHLSSHVLRCVVSELLVKSGALTVVLCVRANVIGRNSIKSSQADSHVRWIIKSNFSETDSISIIRTMRNPIFLMMETELVSETLDFIIYLMWLSAREDCIEF